MGAAFFAIRVDFILEGLCHPEKQTGSYKKLFLFSKVVEKHKNVHTHKAWLTVLAIPGLNPNGGRILYKRWKHDNERL